MRPYLKLASSAEVSTKSHFPGVVFTSAILLSLLGASPALASSIGEINKLTDVSFTSLNPTVSTSSAQSVCAYSAGLSKGYNITATGSGTSSAFTLSAGNGVPVLNYGVQWSSSSGASTGTALTAGVALTGQTTTASVAGCTTGAAATASLIVTLAAADLQTALAGLTYTGTLTLILAAQ